MQRRTFLKSAVIGAASAAVLHALPAYAGIDTNPVSLVQLTPQIKTSRVGMGTGVHASMRRSNLNKMDRNQALDIIRFAYDSGVRFFDMADSYGTHEIVAQALEGKPRDSYVLSTKIWVHPGGIPEKERYTADILLERFLKELKTDYIDLVNLHCMMGDDWESKYEYQFKPMDTLKEKGIIRAHGITTHTLAAAKRGAVNPWVDTMHARLNNAQKKMDGTWEQNVEVLKTAKQNNKGIIIMKVLGEGTINTPEGRKSTISAVTRMPYKDVMIVGFEKREHVTEFLENVESALKEQVSGETK